MTTTMSDGRPAGPRAAPGDERPCPEEVFELPVSEAVLVLGPDGCVRWLNDRFTDFFGHRPSDLVGRSAFELLDERDRAIAQAFVGSAMEARKLPDKTLMRIRTLDGGWVHAEVLVRATDRLRNGPCFVVTIRHVEERWLAVFDALAADEDARVVIERCVQAFREPNFGVVGAALLTEDAGPAVFSTDPLPHELADSLAGDDPGTPWRVAADRCLPVFDDGLTMLPDTARAAAFALGLHACLVHPIPDPSGRAPSCLIAFLPDPSTRGVIEWGIQRRPATHVAMALLARHRREQLHRAATSDPLTGLDNRSPFFERLRDELGRSEADGLGVGLMIIDLDDFKQINDRYGHAAGDSVLLATAGRLRETVRPSDLVARLGGDEFAIICTGVPDGSVLEEIATRLLAAIDQKVELPSGQRVSVGASVGIVVARGGTERAVFDAADRAMYAAKHRGKKQVALEQLP